MLYELNYIVSNQIEVQILVPKYSKEGFYMKHESWRSKIHRSAIYYRIYNDKYKYDFTIDDISEIKITCNDTVIWLKSENKI